MCEVSIIMPVYNKEKYVARAIESVLHQTFQDWEMIIIDDGSTDRSLEICKQYTDTRIHVTHTNNAGVSHARNVGLDQAQGNFVTFLDGDDWLGESYLDNLYQRDSDMVIGGLIKANQAGQVVERILPEERGIVPLKKLTKSFYKEQLATGIFGFVSSKIIRKRVIDEHHLRFDEHIHLAEDLNFFLDIYSILDEIFFTDSSEYWYLQDTENSAIQMKDESIDFFQQMAIQKKIKGLIEQYWSFENVDDGWSAERYREMMAGYAYTIFLQKAPKGFPVFKDAFLRLKLSWPKINGHLSKFGNVVLKEYNQNHLRTCYIMVKAHDALKKQ